MRSTSSARRRTHLHRASWISTSCALLCLATGCNKTSAAGGTGTTSPPAAPKQPAPSGANEAPQGWTRVSADDGFASALFPDTWEIQPEQGVDEESGLPFWEWQAEDSDTIYYFGIEATGGVIEPGSGQEDELLLNFVQENLEALGGELLGQGRVYVDGFTGIGYDLKVKGEDGKSYVLSGRMSLVGDRRLLAFTYSPDIVADEAELFLDSVRLEDKAETLILNAHGEGWGELAMGNAAWLDGKRDAALVWYDKVIASGVFTPEFSANIEDRRARIFFAKGDYVGTAASLESARKGGYDTHMAARIRSALLVRNEDYDAAVDELDRVLAAGGGDLIVASARVQAQAGRLGLARKRLGEGVGSRGDVDVMLNTLTVDVDEALALDPGDAALRLWRALLREAVGDRRGALLDMRRSIAESPSTFSARMQWSWELMGVKSAERSVPFAEWLEARKPQDAYLQRVLGELWMSAKRYEKAEPIFAALIKGDDASAELVCHTAQLYNRMKRETQARDHFVRAVELDPDEGSCRNSLAWILATANDAAVRDGGRAVELAKRFAFDDGKPLAREDMSSGQVDTLAAAYAESGDWNAAVHMQELAIELAKDEGRDEEVLADFLKRRDMYKDKKAWREAFEIPDVEPET